MLIYLSLHHFCDEGHSQILGSGEDGHLLFCLVLKPARVHETNKTHVSYLLRQKHQLYAQAWLSAWNQLIILINSFQDTCC